MAMKSLPAKLAACACGLALAAAQQAGTRSVEGHPRVELRKCSAAGGCSQRQHDLTMDANWRWVHEVGGYENCYKGKEWVEKHCADPVKCTANCALEAVTAAEYQSTYGVKEVSGGVELKFVSHGQGGANFGSRLYMLEDAESYTMFKLKNREFSLEVDASNLPCGLNGAAYFVEMDRLGGKGKGNNHAGAKYGTGYCDAQCPHDIKFIDGEANSLNWNSTSDPPVGHFGTCCAEMDIWEANGMATAYTPHPCEIKGQRRCEGIACGDNEKGERYQGVCDKDGCDFNSYRMGEKSFYGADSSFSLNTKKPVTVVTQFLTVDGTDTGELSEIRRFYMQDGKTIPNSYATLLGPGAGNSITDQFCSAQKAAFKDTNDFHAKGALRKMGEALERGVVLVLSLWDDTKANMLWLDSAYPLDLPAMRPGVSRGPCPGGKSSTPSVLRSAHPDASVRFRHLAVGEIGSTTRNVQRRLAASDSSYPITPVPAYHPLHPYQPPHPYRPAPAHPYLPPHPAQPVHPYVPHGECQTGRVKKLLWKDPMCGAACPGSCSALNAILEAYSGSGTHGAKRVLCARLPELSCLVSHPGKCPCLRSHWKMWGVSMRPYEPAPTQTALDAACNSAHPYLPQHPYRPRHPYHPAQPAHPNLPHGECQTGRVKRLLRKDPMCGAACPGSCSALNDILEAYSTSGTHGAKRVLCARLPELSCLVSHPGKCPCLRSHWKRWGVSLGRGGWPSQAALDAACHPAHPYLPPHPYRPPHHCRYDPHHPICRPYAEMAEFDEDSLLEDCVPSCRR